MSDETAGAAPRAETSVPSREDRLAELLQRWDQALDEGSSCTPQELVADCPDLAADFEKVLRRAGKIKAALAGADDTMPSGGGNLEIDAGRYRVLAQHASGGQGLVYSAEDSELRRVVALKCLKPVHVGDASARARFQLEAEITGKLEHPGILPIHGLGHDRRTGTPYYVMRMVGGNDTLDKAIRAFHEGRSKRSAGESNVQFRRLLEVFKSVCQTIAYAHARGVIHRDLKPANIMLGNFGATFVIDWGLAKQVVSASGKSAADLGMESLHLTPEKSDGASIVGLAKGTPSFMSPEQARGEWTSVGPATDIYGLGATLYVLLTGRNPYQGTSDDARRRAWEVLEQVQAAKLPTAPRKVAPWVPAALEAVCLKAMAPAASDRYVTAAELAADIERYLADEPVSCRRESALARARRWVKRHRTMVAAATATATATLLAVWLMLGALAVRMREKNIELERAVAEKAAALEALQQKNVELEEANRRETAAHAEALLKGKEAEENLTLTVVHVVKLSQAIRSPEMLMTQSQNPLLTYFNRDLIDYLDVIRQNATNRQFQDVATILDGIHRLIELHLSPEQAGVAPDFAVLLAKTRQALHDHIAAFPDDAAWAESELPVLDNFEAMQLLKEGKRGEAVACMRRAFDWNDAHALPGSPEGLLSATRAVGNAVAMIGNYDALGGTTPEESHEMVVRLHDQTRRMLGRFDAKRKPTDDERAQLCLNRAQLSAMMALYFEVQNENGAKNWRREAKRAAATALTTAEQWPAERGQNAMLAYWTGISRSVLGQEAIFDGEYLAALEYLDAAQVDLSQASQPQQIPRVARLYVDAAVKLLRNVDIDDPSKWPRSRGELLAVAEQAMAIADAFLTTQATIAAPAILIEMNGWKTELEAIRRKLQATR